MRGFEKLQPAELDEGNVAARQFDFERCAVMRRAEQHGLRFEADAVSRFASIFLDDVAGLGGVVGDIHQRWKVRRGAVRPEVLGETFGGKIDDGIRRGEDRAASSGSCAPA